MYTKFKLYDDLGVLFTGTENQCKKSFIAWCKSQAAKDIYSASELRQAINEGDTDLLGFTISSSKQRALTGLQINSIKTGK